MKYSACLALLSLSALPACFSSTGLDEEACGPNPCEWTVVDYCEESRECGVLDWCGTTVYCELQSPPPPCTEPRPVCDGDEVDVCPGTSNCTFVEWCDEAYYCATESCHATFPECPGGEIPSEIACSAGEVGCTALTGCNEGFYCREEVDCFDPVFEPCAGATSTVWANGEGQCPDFDGDAYCYDAFYCGAQHYCVTACAPGDTEVFHPAECSSPNDCYVANPWRDDLPTTWCEGGGGPACRAIPTCDGGEEIPLDAACTDGYCEFRSECSTTIQCMFRIVVG